MDIHAILDVMSRATRSARSSYHLTLGKLTAILSNANGTLPVVFDHGGSPGELHSYRGFYEDLSMEPREDKRLANELLAECRAAYGKTFVGYKGGDYRMADDTPLWSAHYGRTGRAIVGAKVGRTKIVLETKEVD